MGRDYLEIHYEDLVSEPRETLARLSTFTDHDLDYDRIQAAGLGSVHNPNSSFKTDNQHKELSPVGRWKTLVSPTEIAELESVIGDLLVKTGYPLVTPPEEASPTTAVRLMSVLYPTVFDVKFWLKSNTPLGRIADVGRMGITEARDL
jgi:hypothetical protein